ncbi:uncharacterized protein MKK02DRAFT_29102 [Dioszegia hungarica]|uniref:GATA-type domain-containing protein n=1 Tax=Dioszegia hungarica TaxID=4972 RepID=A0AA38H2Z7_9TREE|nr:uncharacterized protein MKK02DRAFT_29102 [Dioszegia hungarica]KAI9633228.1 hypothetical protein MKK02DRAFT_29102 [Dioszegia hungarica]
MTPAPGKIHTLPVKVSYTVDSSAQTYFTVLPERQKVYVHPRPSSRSTGASAGASSDAGYYGGDSQGEEGGLGSCVLKSVAWGVCYASPECVPAPTSHDFSVYSLDPSPTSTSTSRAFPSQSDNGDLDPLPAERWDGKGFLSWALYEPNDGTTLIRGRVVYDPDAFEGVSFNPAGGLEGLLALSQEGEGEGEEGWGLEVQLSLRMVNLGGRAVGDKKEFGEMLARVKEGGAGRGGGGLPIMSLPAPLPAVRREEVPGRRRIEPRLIDQSEVSGGTFGISTGLERRGLGGAVGGPGPARTSSSAAANLPTSEGSRPRPPLPHRSSLSGVTSVPPSSVPMAATSSESSRPMFAAPPLPPASLTPPNSNSKPPASSAAPVSDRDERETTPPTAPTRRSPPPSTPSRLQAILRSDAKLSPNLARSLANNPTLLRLLKSVPASAAPLAALNKLRSPFDNESGEADAGGSSTDPGLYGPPPPPPAFLRSSPAQAQAGAAAGTGTGTKPSPAGSSASHAAATPNFNTPGSAATITKASTNGKKGAAASASASGSTSGTGAIGRMCDNCETTKSRCWHSRPSKAQPGAVMSVCEECAVYFNKHKKMRPVSLTAKAAGAGAVGQGEGEGSGSGEGTPGAGTSAKAKGKAKAKAAEPKKTGVGVGVGVGVGIGVGAGAETTPPTSVSKTGAAEMMAAASAAEPRGPV